MLAHTYLPNSITGVRVNGAPASEGRLNALVAAEYGVPVILVTGDDVTCEDAASYAAAAQTSAVKDWVSRYSAVCRPPRVTAAGIRAAAASAVKLAGCASRPASPAATGWRWTWTPRSWPRRRRSCPPCSGPASGRSPTAARTAWDMIRCFKAVTTLISAAIENAYG